MVFHIPFSSIRILNKQWNSSSYCVSILQRLAFLQERSINTPRELNNLPYLEFSKFSRFGKRHLVGLVFVCLFVLWFVASLPFM